MKKVKLLSLYASLYATLFVIAPIMGDKVASIFGVKFIAALPVMMLAYLIVDIVNNNWGKEEARSTILNAAIIRFIIYLGVIPMVMAFTVVKQSAGFTDLISSSFRILIAAEVSMFLGQYFIDVGIFDKIKEKMNGRFFSVRYNLSNIVSQAFITTVFILIAKLGVIPVWPLIWGGILFRTVSSIVITPLASGLNMLTRKLK